MPEIIMIFIILALLAIPVGIAIALLWYFTARSKRLRHIEVAKIIEERLSEIDSLRANNMISEVDYELKRSQILSGI